MQISVPLIDGFLADEYGKYAPADLMVANHPVKSFPIHITDAPAGTKSFALVFIDFDSTPVCGFTWIHWLAANIPATLTAIPADASRQLKAQFVQGKNSNAGRLVNGDPQIASGYVGPQPPDKAHDYTLAVYALDTVLPLENGYWLNDFLHAAEGHVLAKAKATIPSRA
ncbi:YbhB/YbcL family Raf kinase inhibitor-like protein [Limosilactobacillus sp.]|uniref:YbhB/YbcL family Raf kinase inhibitor-like protein n=1 Tax=Limosilactobacillus sp. TaxID=2773925 RepID=UPI0035A098BC